MTSKADLPGPADAGAFAVSALTGAGLEALLASIAARAAAALTGAEPALITRARHRRALEDAAAALARLDPGGPIELVAEDLRAAGAALGRISGRISVDEVLAAIFAQFCIGK